MWDTTEPLRSTGQPIRPLDAARGAPRSGDGSAVSRRWRVRGSSLALLLASLVAALLLGAPVPNPRLTSDLASDQGELSWEAVTLDAIASDARFGVDVVYTFGPLADVYIDQYHPAVWPRARLAKLALLLLLGTYAWLLSTMSPLPAWRRGLSCLALVLPATQINSDVMPDGLFFTAAVLAQLVCIARPRAWTFAISALVGAYLSLAKFSFFPLYGVAVLLPLVVEPRWRRAVLISACTAALMPVLWVASGQQVGDLLSFVRSSAALAAGYGPAMVLDAADMRLQVVIAVPLFAAVVALGPFTTWDGTFRQRIAIAVVLGAAAYLVFKASFTRQDFHVWIGFVWLASIGTSVALLCRLPTFVLATLAALFATFAWHVERTVDVPYPIRAAAITQQMHRIGQAFITPSQTIAQVDRQYSEQLARVRALPLSRLVRKWHPADLDSRNQIPALAVGDARPGLRPVFQSAAAYAPALAALNRTYLEKLPAGATVILDLWTYDDRHPGLQQSGAWDLLIRDFALVEYAPPFVVLRKQQERALTCDVEVRPGRLGEFLELPAPPDGAIVLAAPAFRRTIWGRLRQFAFRDAMVTIDTRAGQSVEQDRYVVAMGSEGFLLQPQMRNAGDLAAVWDAHAPRSPTQVRIRTLEQRQSYEPEFEWQLKVCHADRSPRAHGTGQSATGPRHPEDTRE